MKNLLFLLFCLPFLGVHAQDILVHFDDSTYKSCVFIDTINCHHNNWQVGRPNKTVFTSAHSLPNAIVTDTIHPYSANDTSVFIVKVAQHYYPGYAMPFVDRLSFWYQLDIDSNATAKVEISGNNGLTWRDMIKDSTGVFDWWTVKPNFDTSTYGWKWVNVDFLYLYDSLTADSTLFRFTYLSGSNSLNKDGWIIDDLTIWYYAEGLVPGIQSRDQILIYPNPTTTSLTIQSTNQPINKISITNLIGQTVYTREYYTEKVQLDVADFSPGIYLIRINGTEVRKFVKG